ncbi:hypothetical protein D3C85_1068470 [compost metagenome]
MQEGWHYGVPDVVMLAIDVQPRGRPQGRVRRRRPGITQGTGGTDDTNDRQRFEAQLHTQGHENRRQDRHRRERRADAHGHQQPHQQHQQRTDTFAVVDPGRGGLDQAAHFTGGFHHFGETRCGDHDETDHGHHLHAFGEQVIRLTPAHDARQREDHKTGQRADDHRIQPQLNDKCRRNGTQRNQ